MATLRDLRVVQGRCSSACRLLGGRPRCVDQSGPGLILASSSAQHAIISRINQNMRPEMVQIARTCSPSVLLHAAGPPQLSRAGYHPGDPRWAAAARFDRSEAPRALTSATGLARSADRARLCLSPIRIQRSTHVKLSQRLTLLGPAAFSPTPSAALRYWNMARQRYCRWSPDNRNTLRVSADPAANQPRIPARKAGVLDLRKGMRARDGLSAGGRRIRALGPSSLKGGSLARAEIQKSRTRNLPKRCCQGDRGFKPRSGHRRVRCEPDFFARRTPRLAQQKQLI